jgi:hypothetical protein
MLCGNAHKVRHCVVGEVKEASDELQVLVEDRTRADLPVRLPVGRFSRSLKDLGVKPSMRLLPTIINGTPVPPRARNFAEFSLDTSMSYSV